MNQSRRDLLKLPMAAGAAAHASQPSGAAAGKPRKVIEEFDPATGSGTGFLFVPYEGRALLAAVDRALSFYPVKEKWTALMRNAMSADFSWDRSARSYLDLYCKLSR